MPGSMPDAAGGPLSGVRILEFAADGPVAFCGMLLSDMGADVLRIDRPNARYDRFTIEARGRRSICLDLKKPEDVATALELIGKADVLLEGYRPGVMERLGLGPDVALDRNPALVFGRMTGWGQAGPYAAKAGHDINFIAITGALHSIGTSDRPVPPLNLVGDFGGGALYLVMGVLAALRHAERTGTGQVVDCAMTDGTISLMSMIYGHLARGTWNEKRESNFVDGGAHFYGCYQCADGKWIALGALEPNFYATLRKVTGLEDAAFDAQLTPSQWPELKARLATVIARKTRAEWEEVFEGSDACFAPILSPAEAMRDPHNLFRQAFVEMDGVQHPAPAPRFSVTPAAIQSGPARVGEGEEEALREWGITRGS